MHIETSSQDTMIEFHEVCLAFPLMDDEAFKELCDDIKAHGLRNAIVTCQGKIIDGRNRYNACRAVGVAPTLREWDGKGSLVAYVISLNLMRRHLDASQRAMLGAKLKPMFAEEAAKRQEATRAKPGEQAHRRVVELIPGPQDKGKARDHAARAVGVNPKYIDAAEKVLQGSPELAKQVEQGQINIPQAKKVMAGATIEEAKKRKPHEQKEPTESKDDGTCKGSCGLPYLPTEDHNIVVRFGGFANYYVDLAILQLQRIEDDDPDAIPALARVKQWIAEKKEKIQASLPPARRKTQ